MPAESRSGKGQHAFVVRDNGNEEGIQVDALFGRIGHATGTARELSRGHVSHHRTVSRAESGPDCLGSMPEPSEGERSPYL